MNDAQPKNADLKIKQQVIEKIKNTENILVTVSRDPSVDDLTALLGLTALLNKLGKRATAIFSGNIPAAINFLDPEKVIENTADSLRDFIIALDKEKADHLRYKIEGDVVKIFITPYRTSISSSDLEFTQGDLNVELVLALGIEKKEKLDEVLASQKGLFNDTTIITLSDGTRKSELGNLDWNDKDASCLSEMVVSLAESLKTDKSLLDKQISTALLTGIVSSTNRFSNIRTTSKVMKVSAELMAAGADQQLIAAKLSEEHEIQTLTNSPNSGPDTYVDVLDSEVQSNPEQISTLPPVLNDSLSINHDEVVEPDTSTSTLAPQEEVPLPEINDIKSQTDTANDSISTLSPEDEIQKAIDTIPANTTIEPSLGGTLNATTEIAAEEARKEQEDNQNKTILTHSYIEGSNSSNTTGMNSTSQGFDKQESVDIFDDPPQSTLPPETISKIPNIEPISPVDGVTPVEPGVLPMPPPLPDFSTLPPETAPEIAIPTPTATPTPTTEVEPIAPPQLNVPNFFPAPDSMSTLAPDPNQQNNPTPNASTNNDPSSFQIPGQQ